ncbi:MAG TPA: hypothetical protein VGM78_15095, partial [Ilumatobacteraceae bacterium]
GELPLGFSVPTADGSAPHGAVGMGLSLAPIDGSTGKDIDVSISPNYDGDTLDSLAANTSVATGGAARSVVGGIERLTANSAGFTYLTWLDRGMILFASGRVSATTLDAFVAGIQPATAEQVRQAGDAVSQWLMTMPVLDRVTFADGTIASVRTNGRGSTALCVEAPFQHCKQQVSESTLVGDTQTSIFEAFATSSGDLAIGWISGSATPTVRASDQLATTNTFTSAVINSSVPTAVGEFFEVRVPQGEVPPTLVFNVDVGLGKEHPFQAPLDLVDD